MVIPLNELRDYHITNLGKMWRFKEPEQKIMKKTRGLANRGQKPSTSIFKLNRESVHSFLGVHRHWDHWGIPTINPY